jgi:hypothetical protein
MGGKSDEMKAETLLLLALTAVVVIVVHLYSALTYHEPPIPPCGDFHNCRIVGVSTDGDSAIYYAVLLDTCRHSHLVHFKAEADRFNAGDTAQGNFFGQLKTDKCN